jgi:hypothetical protein
MKKTFFFLALGLSTLMLHAQQRPTVPGVGGTPGGSASAKTNPKPYKEVITDKAITSKGLFTVHKVDDKWYFEIDDKTFGKDILAVTRFSKVAGGGGVYGGELVNQQTIQWEKGPNQNVFLRVITLISVANETDNIFKAVANSNVNPIAASFNIAAWGKDSNGAVIDVTDFFKGDNQAVSLNSFAKRRLNISSLASDKSYVKEILSFPINTEIKTVKTFNANPPSPVASASPFPTTTLPAANAAGVVTLEMNTSFLQLPEKPMNRRLFDPRVGFFADDYTVYSDDQQKVKNDVFAVRWRLEPKPEDMEKYKRGELVEPKKPIVYYIDPATPKKWRKYLIDGVNDWQKAFEKAGFKNAIIGKEWPENDPSMSMEDARYSVIRYFASDIQNAYGPNVHDPRSGEILESHIGWYHNVMSLLHNWFMVQTAAVDADARKMNFSDELMGELIRFVSSHEVGHTLGLRHNMGSSSKTPVEKLRDKAWVEANGHTASIMDYARFNYVAQPEDNISKVGLFPRIGDYDKWAIEWGYKYLDLSDAEEDKKVNGKWILDRLAKNPRLWFGTETNPYDPRSQTEDLGDNNMKASEYGIKNLKRILDKLPEWTKEEGDKYENLKEMYSQVVGQFNRYVNHVTKNIGGIYETPKSVEEKGDVYEPTPKAIQKEAVNFLIHNVYETPNWLINKNILNKFANPTGTETVLNLQTNNLANVLSASRLGRLLSSSIRYSNTYSADELMTDVRNAVWSELKTGKAIDASRRNLQKKFVSSLNDLMNPPSNAASSGRSGSGSASTDVEISDIPSLARAHLKMLEFEVKAAISKTSDKLSVYHLQDVLNRIKNSLDPK